MPRVQVVGQNLLFSSIECGELIMGGGGVVTHRDIAVSRQRKLFPQGDARALSLSRAMIR